MRSRLGGMYFKNFITIVLLFSVSFLILGASFAGLSYSFVLDERTDSMLEGANTIGAMLRSYTSQSTGELDTLTVRALLSWCAEMTGYELLVTNEEGLILNCSDRDTGCAHVGLSIPAGAVAAINRQGKLTTVSTLGDIFEDRRFVVGLPLPAGRAQGYILVSDSAGRLGGIWRSFAEIYLFAALVVVLLSFVLSFIVVRRQVRPIKEMSDAARAFAGGDFTPRVRPRDKHDEVAELIDSFNAMADSLERSEQGRRELIANVSHELKTPMTTIAGFADGILDGTIPKEREAEYLQIISSETKRLTRLIRGMLDMSQLQSATPMELSSRSFDLLDVICVTLLSLEQKITSRDLDVDAILPEEPIYAAGNRDAITQVIHNLLDNAAKFATPGTAITVRLWREDGRAYVSVENQGETIPKEELPLIFDRFHKTDKSRSMDRDGVGLGLYIVKTILDSHGSSIFVTSRDGITKFEFSLKLARKLTENS